MRIRRARAADSAAAAAVVRSVYDEYGFTWDEHGYHADLRDVERPTQPSSSPSSTGASSARPGSPSRARWSGSTSCPPHAAPERARRSSRPSPTKRARRGHDRLEIWSDKRFEDAHRLYRREGARVVGERVHDDPDSSHEWGLVLDL